MSILVLFDLLVVALLFLFFRKTKIATVLLAAAIVLAIVIGNGWLPSILLERLQSTPRLDKVDWKKKNVIVLLGAGARTWPESGIVQTHPLGVSRVHEAARLFVDCHKQADRICKLLITGGDPGKNGISEAEVMRNELLAIGVGTMDDVVTERESENTFENAKFSSELLRKENFDTTIIVTSGFHLKRALLYFSHFNVAAIGAPSDRLSAVTSLFPQAQNFAVTDLAIHEHVGLVRYPLYNVLGVNADQTKPGSP